MSVRDGARNLLATCAGATPADRILLAVEPESHGYFSADVAEGVLRTAAELGLSTETVDVGFAPERPALSEAFLAEVQQADIIIFLSRLGDQLRFSEMPSGKRFVICFTLDGDMLGSSFGSADYRAFCELKQAADRALARARSVRITCERGTDVEGRPDLDLSIDGDTTSMRFPMSVHTPVPAHPFSGRVALPGFLTGTGSKYYAPYTVEFGGPVAAILKQGRLAGFEGSDADVALAARHYDFVSARFGIDRDFVHSWHAGIHPGCAFAGPARASYERWSGAAFGNPRLMHFHTCGAYAPGEISWNVVDPSITVDGVPLWERGRFQAHLLPEGPEILGRYPDAAAVFAEPAREIGLA